MKWLALLAVALTAATAPPNPHRSPSPKPRPSPVVSPSPKPSPKPSPSPSSKPTPTPQTSPSLSAPPPLLTCLTSSVGAVPPQTATFAGALTVQGVPSPIAVMQAGPAAMLPPQLGKRVLVAMQLTKSEDALSSTLQDALTKATVFPCALLSLGQTATYAYAKYAFQNVEVIGLQSSLDSSFKMEETFTLSYDTVRWDYELTGASKPVTGSGRYGAGGAPVAHTRGGPSGPWPWIAGILLVLLAIGAGWARIRRIRR